MEVFDDLGNASRICRAHKGHGQRGDGLEHGDGPFFGIRELLRVAPVLGEEVDDVGRLGRALAGVAVVEDGIGDAVRVEDQEPV